MAFMICDGSSSDGSTEEPDTFSQSSASASEQPVGEESTYDGGTVNFVSSVDALGNNTISMVNNTSSPLVVSSIVNFAATVTDALSALTSQVLRNNALIVSNSVVLSPQIVIGGYSECLITVELPRPIRVRIIVSRLSATVFNIIYKRVW